MSARKLRVVCIGVLVMAGVGAGAGRAPAQTTLRYQFKQGDKLPYVMNQKMVMRMNVQGMDLKVEMNQTLDLTWNITAVDAEGRAKMTQKIERLRFVMDGPMGNKLEYDSKGGKEPEGPIGQMVVPALKALAGAEFTLTMDRRGKISDFKVPAGVLEALKKTPGMAAAGSMFSEEGLQRMTGQSSLILPAEPVMKGTTWDQQTDVQAPNGKMKIDTRYTYQGPTTRDGKKLEEIALKPQIALEADPKAPAAMKLKSQDSKGASYFDNGAGRLVETDVTQNMEMELNAGGQNLTQKVEQTVTLKLQGPSK